MKVVYTIIIYLYKFIIWVASFFNKKAKLWINGRKNIWEKIKTLNIPENKKVVWIHVSSLGEFEQGRPLIEEIKKNFTSTFVVLTFFSPSGYEIRKNYQMADAVLYLPLDTKNNAKKFYEFIKPNIVFFVKYDFWYYFISEAHKRNIPIFLISAVFKEQNIFFKWYGSFFLNILKLFTKIYTQDEYSKYLLEKNKIQAEVAGDTRCDRVLEISETASVPSDVQAIVDKKTVVVAGSVWLEDVKRLTAVIKQNKQVFWIIAPHCVESSNVNRIIDLIRMPVIKYSELKNNKNIAIHTNILIIDNIGMLSSLYKVAHIAYIGGGFGKGIHNILEPAVYAIPVIFGPKFHKFNEAVEMIKLNSAFFIKNEEDAIKIFSEFLQKEEYRKIAGIKAKNYVKSKSGATKYIINDIKTNFI